MRGSERTNVFVGGCWLDRFDRGDRLDRLDRFDRFDRGGYGLQPSFGDGSLSPELSDGFLSGG